MKIRMSLAAVWVAAAFVGCVKNDEVLPLAEDEAVELEIKINGAMTKVAGTDDENKVHDVQIFIFDHNGMLEAYASGDESQSSVSLSCSTGQKEIVALVNAMPHGDVKSLNLTSNAVTQIDVSRIASRVRVSEISVDFGLDQHDSRTFQIKSVYLVNVAGDRNFLKPVQPGKWYNRMMRENDAPSITGVSLIDAFASVSKPYADDIVLYCYPNPTKVDANGGEWSPRMTRLVVEAELDGKLYYYPVSFKDGMASNMTYDVKIKITRLGSSSPDVPVDSVSAGFTVEVQPWGEVTEVEEII